MIFYYFKNIFNYSPAGWDNMKKISILHENLQSMKPDDYYRDVIAQPSINRKVWIYMNIFFFNIKNFIIKNCFIN